MESKTLEDPCRISPSSCNINEHLPELTWYSGDDVDPGGDLGGLLGQVGVVLPDEEHRVDGDGRRQSGAGGYGHLGDGGPVDVPSPSRDAQELLPAGVDGGECHKLRAASNMGDMKGKVMMMCFRKGVGARGAKNMGYMRRKLMDF